MSFVSLIVLVCSVGAALGRPQAIGSAVVSPIPILVDERIPINNGNYGFRMETGNGISFQESASPLPPAPGAAADPNVGPVLEVVGSYSFTHPDGTVHTMNYVAGPQGFVPSGPMIPTPPPMPAFVLEQIAFAEQQRLAAQQQGSTA